MCCVDVTFVQPSDLFYFWKLSSIKCIIRKLVMKYCQFMARITMAHQTVDDVPCEVAPNF